VSIEDICLYEALYSGLYVAIGLSLKETSHHMCGKRKCVAVGLGQGCRRLCYMSLLLEDKDLDVFATCRCYTSLLDIFATRLCYTSSLHVCVTPRDMTKKMCILPCSCRLLCSCLVPCSCAYCLVARVLHGNLPTCARAFREAGVGIVGGG